MSENNTDETDLKSRYAANVTADLERNSEEQKRLRADIAALQTQLETLERDHALLLGVQQVFDGAQAAPTGTTAAPAPQEETAAPATGAKVPRARRAKRAAATTDAPEKKRSRRPAKKAPAKKAAGKKGSTAKQPSLVQLVSGLLAAHGEPRSAAEVTSALAEQHPERKTNINVVRNALEALVAKNVIHRSKQQQSVYYTHANPEPAAAGGESTERAPAPENA